MGRCLRYDEEKKGNKPESKRMSLLLSAMKNFMSWTRRAALREQCLYLFAITPLGLYNSYRFKVRRQVTHLYRISPLFQMPEAAQPPLSQQPSAFLWLPL
jgi:hypothetical protein